MTTSGDTEGWAIASFVVAVLGLLGALGTPTALVVAVNDATDPDEQVAGIIGTFVVLAFVPVLAVLMAETGKRRVEQSDTLRGFGLAHAAEILSVMALVVVLAWAAVVVAVFRDAQGG